VPAEETIVRVRKFAPAFGIAHIANLTGLDRTSIQVITVFRPNALVDRGFQR
jgi:ribosomal protein S12 methylthiotransferase accessory factor YcaO